VVRCHNVCGRGLAFVPYDVLSFALTAGIGAPQADHLIVGIITAPFSTCSVSPFHSRNNSRVARASIPLGASIGASILVRSSSGVPSPVPFQVFGFSRRILYVFQRNPITK
jgi:hypothetical protein